MARIRYIKPAYFSDAKTADLSRDARLLYIGLWCHMDRNGICEYEPKEIKREVFPYDEDITYGKLVCLIEELVKQQRVIKFEQNSKVFLYAPKLKLHQNFHRDEKPRYEFDKEFLVTLRFTDASTVPAPSNASANTTGTGTGTGTGNGELVTGTDITAVVKVTPPENGVQTPEALIQSIPEKTRNRWRVLYDDQEFLDRELIKAHGYYVQDNPKKCPKSVKGWSRALTSWFEKNWAWRAKSIPGKAETFQAQAQRELDDQLEKLFGKDGKPA